MVDNKEKILILRQPSLFLLVNLKIIKKWVRREYY